MKSQYVLFNGKVYVARQGTRSCKFDGRHCYSVKNKKKKKCTHQLNKSRCSDNGANSIGQTTDIGGIKRDGRLKISLNCHDNGRRAHIHIHTGHATPRYAVRIIKRNYCRAVVNNALLLKRVPGVGARILRVARRYLCREIIRTHAGLICVPSRYVRFPQLTLT